MKTDAGIRKIILSLFTLLVIISTTLVFHNTQSAYKNLIQGNKHFEKGQYYEAIPFLVSAFKAEPHNITAAKLLLWSYERLDMKKEAKNTLNILQSKHPEDLLIMEELADAYYALSDYDRAETFYRKILKRKPKIEVEKSLAEVLVWQKKYGAAIPILEELVDKRPGDSEHIELLADVYSWSKEHEKAIDLYKKLLSINYKVDDITLKLADALRFTGRDEEAIELYNKYLDKKE